MSDYIPTTAEVRDAYSSESSDSKFANRAFDLWLARYKAKVIAQAEQRIIKLLEDMNGLDDWYQGTIDKPDGPYIDRKDAIALIKNSGHTKDASQSLVERIPNARITRSKNT